jgi:hypothetical protein
VASFHLLGSTPPILILFLAVMTITTSDERMAHERFSFCFSLSHVSSTQKKIDPRY